VHLPSRYYPNSSPNACHRCFADRELIHWIKNLGKRGKCGWCGARNTYVVDLISLGELFDPIVKSYYPSDSSHGDSLSDLIQDRWEVFSARLADKGSARNLLRAIMDAGVDPKDQTIDFGGLFHSRNPYRSTLEKMWEEQAAGHSSFDPDESEGSKCEYEDEGFTSLDEVSFALGEYDATYPADKVLYRARIYTSRERKEWFDLHEMGAPPPAETPAGRANRIGQPVLYMGSDIQTALAEVRVWKGAPASIARMRVTRKLNILDLTVDNRIKSPFFHANLGWELETIDLMHRFAEELSRPVMPHESVRLYRPTQHLCDLAKAAGRDGIAYPSAMGPGHNVVLFDPCAATPEEVTHHRVDGVTFKASNVGPYERPHEDVSGWTRIY
jgi:RES domain-containing protein